MNEWQQDENDGAPDSVSSSIFVDAGNQMRHARTDSFVSVDENMSAAASRTSGFEEPKKEEEDLSEHLLSIDNDMDVITSSTPSSNSDDESKPSPAFSFSRVTCRN